MQYYIKLQNRDFLTLTGPDRYKFLQGLVTNDIHKLSEEKCLYSALLTPKGRFLHDFFIYQVGESVYLEVDCSRLEDLNELLKRYKLRSKVDINLEKADVICLFGDLLYNLAEGMRVPEKDFKGFVDPRLKDLGVRIIFSTLDPEKFGATEVTFQEYDKFRLSLGIPEAGRDMIIENAIPLESGLDELNAIDWQKGCYLGQELNARTKHQGMVRKRLLPVEIEGDPVEILAPITWNGVKVGSMRSSSLNKGIARLSLEAVTQLKESESFFCGATKIKPHIPKWLRAAVL